VAKQLATAQYHSTNVRYYLTLTQYSRKKIMKKIISFVLILVLALGTIAKAEETLPRPDTAIGV
jgi:hypothetical protein